MKTSFVIIAAVLTFAALTGCGSKQTATPPALGKTQNAAETAKQNKPTITKAEFDAIENGMTYDEVTKIIGGTGEVISEVGKKGEQFYTVAYMFKGEGSTGANANFMFQEGKLETKAQFGLK